MYAERIPRGARHTLSAIMARQRHSMVDMCMSSVTLDIFSVSAERRLNKTLDIQAICLAYLQRIFAFLARVGSVPV